METDDERGAIYLSEYLLEINEGAGFFATLPPSAQARVTLAGTRRTLQRHDGLFFQGDTHEGVWVIESGRVRTFYVGPSGREITLAYWSPGHFIGGPEVFGRGRHIWSADAAETAEVLFLPGPLLRTLVLEEPSIALSIIDGLISKGKCYSALIQMLGTRSVSERLEQLLVILADTQGREKDKTVIIDRTITYEQIAAIVGATRQWVTQSLDKLEKAGGIRITRKSITILDTKLLSPF